MTKITFELDKLKDFIDGMETTHYGRCGDYYYEEFRLNNEGVMYYCSISRQSFLPEKLNCIAGDDPHLSSKIKSCPVCRSALGLVKKTVEDEPYYVCGVCKKTFKIQIVNPPYIDDMY